MTIDEVDTPKHAKTLLEKIHVTENDNVLSEKKKKHKKREKYEKEMTHSIVQDQASSFSVAKNDICDQSKPVINKLSADNMIMSPSSNSNANKAPIQSAADDVQVKKKRTRVRKRKRTSSVHQQDALIIPVKDKSPVKAKENSDCLVTKTVTLNLPRSKRPNNKRIVFNDSGESDDEKVSSVSENPQHISNPNEVNNFSNKINHTGGRNDLDLSPSYKRVEFSYGNSVMPDCNVNSSYVDSAQVRSDSSSNMVKVYTRHRPIRRTGQELSKQDQLDTVATNKSVILKNSSSEEPFGSVCEGAGDFVINNTNGLGLEDGADMETELVVPVVKDFTGFPALHGPPRTGDKIAFKVLELSETYEPGISNYKEAEVLNYEPNTAMISLKLLNKPNLPKVLGKFDIYTEDDDSIEDETESEVMYSWSALLEPKLL